MPVNKVHKFNSLEEVDFFLRGALIGVDVSKGIRGLTGKALTFTSPAGTVNFVATSNEDTDLFLLKDIKAQVEAAIATLRVCSAGGRVVFVEVSPASGVALAATDQPAKAILGFRANGVSAGKMYNPPNVGTPPQWVHAYSVQENTHVLFTWE